MYSVHGEMFTFYDTYVRLNQTTQSRLTTYRNTNIERLESGLTELGYAIPLRTCGQGSYAMHTMVQHAENDYDIDTAVIFEHADLPASPLKARQRILEGIKQAEVTFKRDPEARTNAVTIWYADGHHIDLAVYRRHEDDFGSEIIEHAGVEWTRRDPTEITEWFASEVARRSPSTASGATVKDGQMRRVVQLLKMFAKMHPSWNLPGGLLISALVAECYQPDATRDDLALYNTMSSIRLRLQRNTEVTNPVDSAYFLTDKQEHVNELVRFEERLGEALDWLQPLFNHDCDEVVAYKAWEQVYGHTYWNMLVEGAELRASQKGIHVLSTGTIIAGTSTQPSVQSPPHRFYGDS
jgi:hypothetical protein